MKPKILIVDDEPDCRSLLREALGASFQIVEAPDGLSAVKTLKSVAGAFDLLISDLKMPIQDGMDTLLEVRYLFPNLKIIIISGNDSDISRIKWLKVDRMLRKPFDIKEVLQNVNQVLDIS